MATKTSETDKIKTKEDVLEGLDITVEDTPQYKTDLLAKLNELAVVSRQEISNIKSVSVNTLPSIVKNDEETVKKRMYGIATDENNGIVALMNKRTVLINELLKDFAKYDLGTLTEFPNVVDNTRLNEVKTSGLYSFKCNNDVRCLMLVSDLGGDQSYVIQYIISYVPGNENSVSVIVRTYLDGWSVRQDKLSSETITQRRIATAKDNAIQESVSQAKEYVDNNFVTKNTYQEIDSIKKFKKRVEFYGETEFYLPPKSYSQATNSNQLINKGYVDTATANLSKVISDNKAEAKTYTDQKAGEAKQHAINLFNQLLGENADTAMDTIGELAEALKNEPDIIKMLEDSITNKIGEEDVMPIVLENSEQAETITIVKSDDFVEGSNSEIPTTALVDKMINERASYTLPLTEASWVRIAKVKDISKNASGTITFDCYGVKEGVLEMFTASVFAVSCGLGSNGDLVTDAFSISQTPELNGASSSDGSGDGGSDGGTGTYGLASVKFEECEGEVFVCGLINYPPTGVYSSLEVTLKIDNNLNFEFLDNLEVVDLDYTNEEENQLLEGMTLKSGKDYEFRAVCNLQDYIDGLNTHHPIIIQVRNTPTEAPYFGVIYNENVLSIKTNETEYNCDSYYPNIFLDLDDLERETGLYLLLSNPNNICDGLFSYYSKEHKDPIHRYTARLKRLSGTLTIDNREYSGFDIMLNDEIIYSANEEQKVHTFYLENLTADDYLQIMCGVLNFSLCTFKIDPENTEIELVLPFIPEQDYNVGYYFIDNNSVYNFNLNLAEITKHDTSASYALKSVYNELDVVRNKIDILSNQRNVQMLDVYAEYEDDIKTIVYKLSQLVSSNANSYTFLIRCGYDGRYIFSGDLAEKYVSGVLTKIAPNYECYKIINCYDIDVYEDITDGMIRFIGGDRTIELELLAHQENDDIALQNTIVNLTKYLAKNFNTYILEERYRSIGYEDYNFTSSTSEMYDIKAKMISLYHRYGLPYTIQKDVTIRCYLEVRGAICTRYINFILDGIRYTEYFTIGTVDDVVPDFTEEQIESITYDSIAKKQLYVSKADYDALLARVEALEGSAE